MMTTIPRAVESLSEINTSVSKSQYPRRIIAEDPYCNVPSILPLKYIILNDFASRYTGQWNLNNFPPEERHYIMKKLPTDFPLIKAVRLIVDETYWRRRCLKTWEVCEVSKYNSWKEMCVQRSLEEMIENFVPKEDDSGFEEITALISEAKDYITKLYITQLIPKHNPHDENNEFEEGHINFEHIFEDLCNLKEFHVTYSMKKCEDNFEWNMFQMTQTDCQQLTSVLMKTCANLQLFDLYRSDLDDAKIKILTQAWQKLNSLKILELPHNKIGDKGAFHLAKMLISNDKITTLNLLHNQIGITGGQAFAYMLSKNSSLKDLNLRLNCIQDEGGIAICKALALNKSLQNLNLAANDIGEGSSEVLTYSLACNKSLCTINLSCNDKIGSIGGVFILEGLGKNSTICHLDLRLCNVAQETEYYINKLLKKNQMINKQDQHCNKKLL